MIRDSRHMYGIQAETPGQVRGAWAAHIEEKLRRGQMPFGEDLTISDFVPSNRHLKAYVNEGRWVADCPRCNGGIAVWAGMPDAACYDCGRIFSDIKFPKDRDRVRAERVLSKRKSTRRMHWDPDNESVEDLKVENAVQGVDFTEDLADLPEEVVA